MVVVILISLLPFGVCCCAKCWVAWFHLKELYFVHKRVCSWWSVTNWEGFLPTGWTRGTSRGHIVKFRKEGAI